MIGVDIIDRECSYLTSKHPFIQMRDKILTAEEFEFCHSKSDLDIMWAIKESAYKVWSKLKHQTFFNPRKIHILSYSDLKGTAQVNVEGIHIYSHVYVNAKFIYSLSSLNKDIVGCQLFFDHANPSTRIKEQLSFGAKGCEDFLPILNPLGVMDEVKIGIKIYNYSRSHHGKYYLSGIMPS